MDVINVSSKGQVVIPEKVRMHLGIKKGSKLVLLEKQGEIIMKREEEVARYLESERKEDIGWMILAEKSLKDIWDNPKDEEAWKRYL